MQHCQPKTAQVHWYN